MATLPDYLRETHHISRAGDRLVVTITADASAFLASLRNLGPAWDVLGRWFDRHDQHHRPEHPTRTAMHVAYDRRRRARRRRTRR